MTEKDELAEIRRKKMEEIIQRDQQTNAETETVIDVSDLNFEEVVRRKGIVVIDCWAAWCAPCRLISPIIDELAKDYVGRIVFGKLNVDKNQKASLEYQVMSIPTILIFKNGQIIDRIVGAMPRRLLEQKITQHL